MAAGGTADDPASWRDQSRRHQCRRLRIDPEKTHDRPIIRAMQYPSRDQADALNARGMSRDAVAAQAWLARLAKPRDFHKRLQWDAAITCEKGLLVRSRGLEPPRVAPLAPQASASTNSATTAWGVNVGIGARVETTARM